MTLLKAYLIGSNDPFLLARVYHDEYILKDSYYIKDYIDEQMKVYEVELNAQGLHLQDMKRNLEISWRNIKEIIRDYELNIWAEETKREKIYEQAGKTFDSTKVKDDDAQFKVIYEKHRKVLRENRDRYFKLKKEITKQKKVVKKLLGEFKKAEHELYIKYAKTDKTDYEKNMFVLKFEKLGLKLIKEQLELTKKMAKETVDEKGVSVLQIPDSKTVINTNKKYKKELDKLYAEKKKRADNPDLPIIVEWSKTFLELMGKWGKQLEKDMELDESGMQYFKKYYTDKIKFYEQRIKRSEKKIKALKSGKSLSETQKLIAGSQLARTKPRGTRRKLSHKGKKTFTDIEVIDGLMETFPKTTRQTFYNQLSTWIEEEPELFNISVIAGYKKEKRGKTHTLVEEGVDSARNRNLLQLKKVFESIAEMQAKEEKGAPERDVNAILLVINNELDRVKEAPVSAKEGKTKEQHTSILDWYKNLDTKLTKLKNQLIKIKGKVIPQVVKGKIRAILKLNFKSVGKNKGKTPVKKVLLTIGSRSIRNAIYELHPIITKRPEGQVEGDTTYSVGKGAFISDLKKVYESIKTTLNHKVGDDVVLEYIINTQIKRKVPQFITETEEDVKSLEDVKTFLQNNNIKSLNEEDEDTLEDILKELVVSYNRLIKDENLSNLDKEGKTFKEILSVQIPKARELIGKMPKQHEKKKELIEAFQNLNKVYGATRLEVSEITLTKKEKLIQLNERIVTAYHNQLKRADLSEDEQRKFLKAMMPYKSKARKNRIANAIMRSENATSSLMQELEALGKLELGAFAEPKKAGKGFLDVSELSEDQLNRLEEQQAREASTTQPKQFTEVGGDYTYEGESAKDADKELEDARIREEEYEQAQEDAKIREEERQQGKYVEEPEEEQPDYEVNEEEYGAGDLTEEYEQKPFEDDES